MIACGGFVWEYPRPGFVIVTDAIVPPAPTTAVPVAVVPIPTPIVLGAENLTGRDAVYPAPGFVTVIAEIVPPAETVAVNPAATGSVLPIITASRVSKRLLKDG